MFKEDSISIILINALKTIEQDIDINYNNCKQCLFIKNTIKQLILDIESIIDVQ